MLIKKGKSQVTFVYAPANGQCKKVAVAGSFNDWQPDQGKMTRQKDGSFRKRFNLTPGDYQYRFIVDGQWQVDPEADRLEPNEFGEQNSVAVVG